ncbi:DUF397 domain-containing protein [Streptomyces sp. bgisy100]|uniref:DUF397 domain-containing protein n=1 Tax=Streptomyces sp. bgisy100 TaxID=3413783 RepID=UPI003D72D733
MKPILPPVSYTDDAGVRWHKSTYSGSANGCIERGALSSGLQAVRDTKDSERSVMLTFQPQAWQEFIEAVKAGEFPV